MVIELQACSSLSEQPFVAGDLNAAAIDNQFGGLKRHPELTPDQPDGRAVAVGARGNLRVPVNPQHERLADGVRAGADAAVVIGLVPAVDHRVELGDRVHFRYRNESITAKPADLTLHPAFLVGAVLAGLAVPGGQIQMSPERRPPFGSHTRAGEPENLADRGFQVVVAHSSGGHTAEHLEGVQVPFEEGFLTGRERRSMDALPLNDIRKQNR